MSSQTAATAVFRDPVLRFFALAGVLYLAWYALYEFVLHPAGFVDRFLIDNLVSATGTLLGTIGYELIPEPAQPERTIGVQGGILLWVGDACNGASLFAVYLIFLLAFPGPWRHKAWFAAVGLLSIHAINILRIAALCIVTVYDYELLNFNHDYTFYVVVYGWVFGLWYLWIERFSGVRRSAAADRGHATVVNDAR
jgi:exosortase family protein XrtF